MSPHASRFAQLFEVLGQEIVKHHKVIPHVHGTPDAMRNCQCGHRRPEYAQYELYSCPAPMKRRSVARRCR